MSIQQVVPAAFGIEKWEQRTKKYNFVSTSDIMGIFQYSGWLPKSTTQVKSRSAGKRDFAKHLITFQNPSLQEINGTFPQINLINSHDGSSTFRLMAGLYRLVCENGLIVSESEFSSIRVRHSKQAHQKIDDAIKEIVEIVPLITAKSEEMNTLIMSSVDQLNLSTNIIEKVWIDPKVRPIEANQLLQVNRDQDKEKTLWNTYNIIQENLVKGGLVGKTSLGKSRKQRGITNIDKNVRVNQILWEETSKFLLAA